MLAQRPERRARRSAPLTPITITNARAGLRRPRTGHRRRGRRDRDRAAARRRSRRQRRRRLQRRLRRGAAERAGPRHDLGRDAAPRRSRPASARWRRSASRCAPPTRRTGQAPTYANQDLSVTIRPDLATPVDEHARDPASPDRAHSLERQVIWIDTSNACLKAAAHVPRPAGLELRRRLAGRHDDRRRPHAARPLLRQGRPLQRAGHDLGAVGRIAGGRIAEAVHRADPDDGRTLVSLTPIDPPADRRRRGRVTVRIARARDRARDRVTITYAGKKRLAPVTRPVDAQGRPDDGRARSRAISLKRLKSRRATIKIGDFGRARASSTQPTPVPRG